MTVAPDIRTLVLHGLRLKGFADTEAVAEAAGIGVGETAAELDAIVAEGLASRRSGKVSGVSLTSAGRAEHADLLAAELANRDARPQIEAAYARFLRLNTDLLTVCTDWQLRPVDGESRVNDHADATYDADVIGRLGTLHEAVAPICDELAVALERFSSYGARLALALELVRSGERDWFTKPMIASYHTVWFELHEDLLCTLGIERGSEVAS